MLWRITISPVVSGRGKTRRGGYERRRTGSMVSLQDPVCLSGLGDDLPIPTDLEMPERPLQDGRAREVLDVELGAWIHGDKGEDGRRERGCVRWMTSLD